MKLLLPLLVLVTIAATVTSCPDQTPAELSFTILRAGQPTPCQVLIWNNKGVQIREESTDFGGVVYVKDLVAGSYKITFQDVSGVKYDAVRWITLAAGDSQNMQVDLDVPLDKNYPEPTKK